MKKILLTLFISLNFYPADLDREDIKEFIKMAEATSELTEQEIITFLQNAETSERAVTARSNQPEVKATWQRYRNRYLTSSRINNGVKFLKEHEKIFDEVEKDFGVSRFYIASIIGCETNYGNYYGTYNPLDTIFTRAFEPNSKFWQKELIQLFLLSKKYKLDPKKIKSSWSGALGLGQFIPSSYNFYGVDYDGDGFIDMYNSRKDGIASVANYLKENGWQSDEKAIIQRAVNEKYQGLEDEDIIDLDFSFELNNFRTIISSKTMKSEGFDFIGDYNDISPLLVYEQGQTKLFLGFDNFRVITKYNRSSKYALAVHQLAMEISKRFDE